MKSFRNLIYINFYQTLPKFLLVMGSLLIVFLVSKSAFAVSSTAVQDCPAPYDTFTVTNETACDMVYSFPDDQPWLSAMAIIDYSGGFWCTGYMYCNPTLHPGQTGTAQASFSSGGYTPGTYNGTITVRYRSWTAGCGSGGSYTVDATFTITPPDFIVSPSSIAASGTVGIRIDSKTFTVTNLDPCPKNYSITEAQSWIGVNPVLETGGFLPGYAGSVYLDPGKTGKANVSFSDPGGPGTYTGDIFVKTGSTTKTVQVTLTIGYCQDKDGDGHYAISATCPQGDDCNDNDPTVYPGAPEICDGKDNNCNGVIDEGCCEDKDGDGHYAISANCPQGSDCNDNDPAINPGAKELCDNKDNNCNGEIDEGLCCEDCCPTNTPFGSSANYASGNLFQTHDFLLIKGTGLTTSTTFAYNSLDDYIGPLGRGWTHNYNVHITRLPSGSLLLIAEGGRRIYFRDDGTGIYYPDPGTGDHSFITINGEYRLTRKDGTIYHFDRNTGKLLKITDRNNNTITLSYTGGNLTSIADPAGRAITITYDASGRVVRITDHAGRVTEIGYNAYGYLSNIKDPAGNIWNYTYDSGGRMLTKTDPAGYTTTYTYDDQGRVITSTDPEGRTKAISYDQANNTAIVTEKDGGVWTYRYDPALNVPLEITDPQGGKTINQYDQNRNLISKTEPDGSVTRYTYDSYGNMTSQTDPSGQTTRYTYNTYGQITSITDPQGNTTTNTYDANGNLTYTTDPTGATTQYWYDSRGNITGITNPKNQTTTFAYDQYNNLLSFTDPAGATTRFTYDTSGNMISQTDAQGNTTRFEYNSLNQIIRTIDPQGNVTTYTYDKNGNRTSQTDANGNVTRYEYNYKGQLIKVTDALGNVTTYTYGGTGCSTCGGGGDKLTSITDAKSQTTNYQYDTLGRLIRETDPLGNTITYTYNSKGNLTSKTDANGDTIIYTYDSLNRLIQKLYPDGTVEVFQYDSKGNIIYAGNQHMAYSFSYDANGRIMSVTDSNGRAMQYSYDPTGSRTQIAYPDGSIINYTYNNANRLSSIINGSGRTTTYSYDSLGRRTRLTYPNGTYMTYSYDASSRLTNLTHKESNGSIINSFTYTHDNTGNRLTKAEADTKYTYSYDSIYRLLQSTPTKLHGKDQDKKPETFTYDPVGNRLTGPEAKDNYYYNRGNQITDDRKNQYQYDKNGNLISKTEIDDDGKAKAWTYYYDYENRLIKVIKQEGNEIKTVTFRYDPFGRRIEKTVTEQEDGKDETKTYSYIYDNEDIILEYLTKADGKTETTRYIHGLGIDEPLSIERKGEIYYYHADGLGSIIALTDAKQKVVESYNYDSFGNLKQKGDKVKNTYTFTAREWDEEIDLYYYRARYYDARVGRFISFDSILHSANGPPKKISCGQIQNTSIPSFEFLKENPQKLNPYVYVENRPITLSDNQGFFGVTGDGGSYPPGYPPGPVCNAYKECCRYEIYTVCMIAGDNGWSNCVRKCLIDRWHNCKYDHGFWNDHYDCWFNICKKQ